MGTQPYGGCYTVYHTPPVLKAKLADGAKLLVSYHHAATVHEDQANICPSGAGHGGTAARPGRARAPALRSEVAT